MSKLVSCIAYSSSLNEDEGDMLLQNVRFSQNYTRRGILFVVTVVRTPNCTLNLVSGSFAVFCELIPVLVKNQRQ
jgi:hypothetical protein